MRNIICFLLLTSLCILTGCGNEAQTTEASEERDPYVKAGHNFMKEQNWDEAIKAFKSALEKEPRMARPHLDLAIIYQQHRVNYIHAIYHYDRYLELRPDSEKAEFINQQKHKIVQALANTLINNSSEVKKVVEERNALVRENHELKQQLAGGQSKTPATSSQPTTKQSVTQTIPKSADQPAATTSSAGKPEIYHVVSGDTLTKIAGKFYGDSGKWDIILDANKDRLASPRDLKVGQTLVIPRISN